MELVYLWVEKYKNIENQGFNFSPRFECSYDGENLTVDEKKDYVNIFPKNINVTAIVGENGSGKSNAFEALLSNFMSSVVPIDEPFKIMSIFYNAKDEKFYYKDLGSCITKIDKEYLYEDVDALLKYKIRYMKDTGIFTFHYNYGLDWIYNNENNLNFNKLFHKTDDYKTPILLQPNKANNQIHISNIDYLAIRDILNFTIQKEISFDFIDKFFTPTKCKLKYEISNVVKGYYDIDLLTEIKQTKSDIEYLKVLSYTYVITKVHKKYRTAYHDIIKDKKLIELIQSINDSKKNLEPVIKHIRNKNFDELFDDSVNYKTDKIKQSFLFITYLDTLDKFDLSLVQEQMLNIKENKDLLINLAPWIEIEFFNDEDVSFYSLSYGQKFLVKFLYSLLNQLNNLTSHPEYQNIILLLDEVELGLHPQWQKEYLSILMNILSTRIEGFNFKYNIICSTHSPFILSDLPKENVIFLKNGEQVDVDINPFGANIHTLLSNGFFMKDGLMGEFAKGKINDVIKVLNSKQRVSKKRQQYYKNIISVIGEPFLKEKLLNMYNEKFQVSKEARIKQLKKELAELEK